LTAQGSDKGACVFEVEGEKTCTFTTRQECTTTQGNSGNSTGAEFFKDYLCTADELATNCGPTTETICVDGKDEVYFKDTCGNAANIYDAQRVYAKDPGYWRKIVPKLSSCNPLSGNTNSKTCGNCNYLKGSICGKGTGNKFICKDLNCYNTKNGRSYKNGESWCESISEGGDGQDPVGNRYFRHVCVQGEEIIEPCADFRNEVCIEHAHEQDETFSEAACRVNRWTDCLDQFTEQDCLNTDKRDCIWASGVHYDGSSSSKATQNLASSGTGKGIVKGGNICLPRYPPGLEFWKAGNAQSICSLGNSKQTVMFEKNIFGSKKCDKNCEVLEKKWIDSMNRVCSNLGDCGASVNIADKFTDFGIAWKQNGQRKDIQTGLLTEVKESAEASEEKTQQNGKVFNK
jgi:hypothetical protein